MLRSSGFVPLLEQINGNGVVCSMLLAADGRILSSASQSNDAALDKTVALVSARAYQEFSAAEGGSACHLLLVDLDKGHVGLTTVPSGSGEPVLLLCSYGTGAVAWGSVRARLTAARGTLGALTATATSLEAGSNSSSSSSSSGAS